MAQKIVTAALIVIGDEILSGRTKDENINFLAQALGDIAVNLKEVRVIPDTESEIIEAVNIMRAKHDYVFTSGGIGPTHDDITAAAITKAFDDKLIQSEEATQLLIQYYGENGINEARLKMAFIPSKAKLIKNSIMSPSGFRVENVFIFAGVPKIFQIMFEGAINEIIGGKKTKSEELQTSLPEGVIAKDFASLQQKYPQVNMGSYPSDKGASLVFRSIDYDSLEQSFNEMIQILKDIQADSVLSAVKY